MSIFNFSFLPVLIRNVFFRWLQVRESNWLVHCSWTRWASRSTATSGVVSCPECLRWCSPRDRKTRRRSSATTADFRKDRALRHSKFTGASASNTSPHRPACWSEVASPGGRFVPKCNNRCSNPRTWTTTCPSSATFRMNSSKGEHFGSFDSGAYRSEFAWFKSRPKSTNSIWISYRVNLFCHVYRVHDAQLGIVCIWPWVDMNEFSTSCRVWTLIICVSLSLITEFVWFAKKIMKWNRISSTKCTVGLLNVSFTVVLIQNLTWMFNFLCSCWNCGTQHPPGLPQSGSYGRVGSPEDDPGHQFVLCRH